MLIDLCAGSIYQFACRATYTLKRNLTNKKIDVIFPQMLLKLFIKLITSLCQLLLKSKFNSNDSMDKRHTTKGISRKTPSGILNL